MNIPARNGPFEAFMPLLIMPAATPHRAYRKNTIRTVLLKVNILSFSVLKRNVYHTSIQGVTIFIVQNSLILEWYCFD